jgi:hypothetical protein
MVTPMRMTWPGGMGERDTRHTGSGGKTPLVRLSRRRDDTTMVLKEIRWGGCGLYSSGSGQGPVAGSCGHGNWPSGSIKRRVCG